jgi:hypothetical protein
MDQWIVIQHRVRPFQLNFNRTLQEYIDGFGDLRGEFWLGMEKIYQLGGGFMRIEMSTADGTTLKTTSEHLVRFGGAPSYTAHSPYMNFDAFTATSKDPIPFAAQHMHECSQQVNGWWFFSDSCSPHAVYPNANEPEWPGQKSQIVSTTVSLQKLI